MDPYQSIELHSMFCVVLKQRNYSFVEFENCIDVFLLRELS